MGLHVLVVARWWPAFDNPGRGSFVADQVAALKDAGVRVTVASFEHIPMRGDDATRPDRLRAATEALRSAIETGVAGGWATSIPRSWGATGVPVARLPVLSDPLRRTVQDLVDTHGSPLLAFGRALAERDRIDLIHAHTGLPDGIVGAQLAEQLGIPLVVTEHSSTVATELAGDDARQLYRGMLGPHHRLAAVSASLGVEVAALTGIDPATIVELPNAVPVERFPPASAEDRDPDELLYVAARRAPKGIERLLRAMAILGRERPGLRLRLVGAPGGPEDEAHWADLGESLGLGERVRFEGALDRAGVAAAMRRAAVFVHPSDHETFGMVAAEALASGLPVAATPSGGVDGIIGTDGRFGEIAADTSPEALADAVLAVLARRDTFDAGALRESIVARFAPAAVATRTIALYRELLADEGSEADGPVAASRGNAGPGGGSRVPADLVTGFGRTLTVDRIADLPAPVRSALVVVTRGKAGVGAAAPAVAEWHQVDVDGEYAKRLAALRRPGGNTLPARVIGTLRSPTARFRRQRLMADPDRSRARILADHIRMAARQAIGMRGRRSDTNLALAVPIEGDDVLAVDALFGRTGGVTSAGPRFAGRIAGLLRSRGPEVRVAPGSLRWLVDRRDAGAGNPAGGSGAGDRGQG